MSNSSEETPPTSRRSRRLGRITPEQGLDARRRHRAVRKEKFLDCLRRAKGGLVSGALRLYAEENRNSKGISRRTHEEWMKEDDAYRDAVEDIRANWKEFPREKLYELAEQGNVQAIIRLNEFQEREEQRDWERQQRMEEVQNVPVDNLRQFGSFTSEEDMKEKTGFTVRRMEHTLKMLADYAPEALRQILVAPNEIPDKAPSLKKLKKEGLI